MKPTIDQVKNNHFDSPNNGPWKLLHTFDSFWWIGNIETGVSKKIGPVTWKGKNWHDQAVIEAAKRNEKLTGIPYSWMSDYVFEND